MRKIGVGYSFLPVLGRRRVISASNPSYLEELFSGGDTGIWFDADQSTMYSTSGGSTEVTVTDSPVGRITDLSGANNHLTVADANRPNMVEVNGSKFLKFQGATQQWLELPALVFDKRNTTYVTVYSYRGQGSGIALWSTGTTATPTTGIYLGAGTRDMTQGLGTYGGSTQLSTSYAPQNLCITVNVFGPSNIKIFNGSHTVVTQTAASAGTATGGYFGRWGASATFACKGLFKAGAIIKRALSDTEVADLIDDLAARIGAHGRIGTKLLITDGDSLTQGVGTVGNGTIGADSYEELAGSYPAQLCGLYDHQIKLVNVADGGQRMTTATGGMANSVNTGDIVAELARHPSYTSLAAILAGGTNDINSDGATSAQLITYATTWYDAITTSGVQKFACTILPRNYVGANETARLEYNSWLTGGTSPFGTRVIDNAGDVRLQNVFDTNVYVDTVHLNVLGYSYMAENAKTALDLHSF